MSFRRWAFLGLLFTLPAWGQIVNGSFETGDLTGWTVGGTGRVQVISATGVNPAVAPFDGNYYVVLSSGPGDVGGTASSLDGQETDNELDVATLSQTISITSVPFTLNLAVMWFTSEGDRSATYDDLFDVTLNGFPLFRHSVAKGVTGSSPWPDFGPTNNSSYTFTASGPIQGTYIRACPQCGRTGWVTTSIVIMSPGTYTLQARVADQGDAGFDSALAIDAVAASAHPPSTSQQLTVTSGVTVEWKNGGLEARLVDSREAAAAENPEGYAFISSGNLTGDNPGAQEQVFYWSGGTTQRLTAATGGSFSHPAVTSNGRFVVFASTANLTGGNSDGNWEIFRVDRNTGGVLQLTNTTAPCQNRFPVIAGDTTGSPVAFISNCGHGTYNNPDGNDEIVVWNGTTYTGTNTTGCQNYAPAMNRGNGQYVAFVTTCNISGLNPDSNPEIFRWDWTNNGFTRITNSADPVANDTPAISSAGDGLVFTSNGNYSGSNSDGSYEVFFWDGTTLRQLSNGSANEAFILARLSDDGTYALGEVLHLTTGQFQIRRFSTGSTSQPGYPIATGFSPFLPAISRQGTNVPLAWQSSEDPLGFNSDGNQEIFRHDPGLAPPRYLMCAAPNLPIPDNRATGVTSSLNVPLGLGNLLDVDAWVLVNHTYVGDLNVFLTSPGGTTRQLVRRLTNGGGGCTGDNIDAVLDDEASLAVQSRCGTIPAVSGFYRPFSTLGAFDFQPTQGTWRLRIEDRKASDVGIFQAWCLAFTSQ
ncbi:MAG: proprotein convertase P-domain-containing protein [Thermoanaerobaculaceae bacterium]